MGKNVKEETIKNCFNKALDSKDDSPCGLTDVPCPEGFEKEVFESQIDLEASFNSNISSDGEDSDSDSDSDSDDEAEKSKSQISHSVALQYLHQIRLCLESS